MWPSVAVSHRQLNTQAVQVSFSVVGWTISRPDVQVVETATFRFALVSHAGKTAERLTHNRPAVNMSWRRRTCRDDGSCGPTGVARTRGRQLNIL